ncbi:MAG: Uma2 family endonuclease [Cyanobacteria bacterium J06581_3]
MPELLTKTVSFSEYLLLPYDGKKTELVNGRIIEMSEPSTLHILIIRALTRLLDRHIAQQDYDLECISGPGVEIPRAGRKSDARDPDLIICSKAQLKELRPLTKSMFLEGNPPKLAVEISSPGNEENDTIDKRLEYALAGIPEYWIINRMRDYVLVLSLDVGTATYSEVGEFRRTKLVESLLFPDLKVTTKTLLDPE